MNKLSLKSTGRPRILCGALVLCAGFLSLSSGASANACPPDWREYVETIGEIIEPLGQDFPLLFVSRAGDVFDCLHLVNDQAFINRATELEKSLPIDRTSIATPDPATWPVNMCTGGRVDWPGLSYVSITLPLDAEILGTEACWRRVTRSAEDLLQRGN